MTLKEALNLNIQTHYFDNSSMLNKAQNFQELVPFASTSSPVMIQPAATSDIFFFADMHPHHFYPCVERIGSLTTDDKVCYTDAFLSYNF